MTAPTRILLKVKTLKEQESLKDANGKRVAATQAAKASEAARTRVSESASTLDGREDAIFHEIIGKVIDLGAIDDTNARVTALEKDHQNLVDLQERAIHTEARTRQELEAAIVQHKKSMRERDKYILLAEEEQRELEALILYKEESEVEELFCSARRRPL